VIDLGSPDDPVVPTASSVAISDGHVWVGAFGGVAEVDLASGKVIKKVDLGGLPALQLAAGGHALWATLLSQRARRVEVPTGRGSAAFYAGTPLIAVARDRAAVWLGGAVRGELWKLDAVTGLQIDESRVGGGTFGLALGAGSLWVASWRDHSLFRVDPATGEVQATIPLAGQPQGVVVRDGLVWVAVQTS
jgi:YVTN family beta-propeller protein